MMNFCHKMNKMDKK